MVEVRETSKSRTNGLLSILRENLDSKYKIMFEGNPRGAGTHGGLLYRWRIGYPEKRILGFIPWDPQVVFGDIGVENEVPPRRATFSGHSVPFEQSWEDLIFRIYTPKLMTSAKEIGKAYEELSSKKLTIEKRF